MLNGQIFSQYGRPENVPFGNPPLRWVGSADLGADAQTRRSLTRGAGGSALRCSRPQALWGSAGSPKASPATRDGCSLSPVILALTAYDCGRRPAPRFFATPAQVTPVCKHPTNCVLRTQGPVRTGGCERASVTRVARTLSNAAAA